MKRALIIAVAFIALNAAAVTREHAGYIEAIRGTVYFTTDAAVAPVRLSPDRDVLRILFTGDRLRCDKGGWARLRVGDETRELKPSTTWFVVTPKWNGGPGPDVRAALDEYGRVGGRTKGAPASGINIFEPAADASARSATFAIRWNGSAASCPLSIAISTPDRRELWKQSDIAVASGVIATDDLREVTRDHRGESLDLTLSGRCIPKRRITFQLLSADDEASLADALATWNGVTDPLLIHFGRASVYARYRLFNEMASEYDAALQLAPHSRDLLRRAVAANERVGNWERVKELGQ